MLKSVLVPIETSPSTDAQLITAARIGKQFGARLDGLAPRWLIGPGSFGAEFPGMTASLPMDYSDDEQATRIEASAAAFRGFMDKEGIPWQPQPNMTDQASARWLEVKTAGDEAVGEVARLYDLSIVPRPVENQILPRAPLLEALLFGSGRPVLATPPSVPDTIGEVIIIPWNGSLETARTLHGSSTLLRQAKQVLVLHMEGDHRGGPSSAELVEALKLESVKAELVDAKPGSDSIGEAILRETDRLGADLMMKGAYTRSRMRQMFFGGITSHLMAYSKIPVLFAH